MIIVWDICDIHAHTIIHIYEYIHTYNDYILEYKHTHLILWTEPILAYIWKGTNQNIQSDSVLLVCSFIYCFLYSMKMNMVYK